MIFDDKFSPENGGDSLKGVLGSALVDAGGGGAPPKHRLERR